MSLKLASTPYFNKLLPSIFRQVMRQERAILGSTYYTGCVQLILGQNLNVARRRRFGQIFDFLAKIQGQFFLDFFPEI